MNAPTLMGLDKLQRLAVKADFERQDELVERYEQSAGEGISIPDPDVESMSDRIG